MGAVMPAAAFSIPFSRVIARSPLWNNRTVVMLVCLASALVFIYHLFRGKKSTSYLPDMSNRFIAKLFPGSTLHKLPFEAPFAQGIIQIRPMKGTSNDLSIMCFFDNRPFFQQPITHSVYLPELPYQKEIIILLNHQQKVLLLTTLNISHMMGIYEIGAPVKKSNSLPQLHLMQVVRPIDPKDPTTP